MQVRRENYEKIANQGYMTLDFFRPGLIIDALNAKPVLSIRWAGSLRKKVLRPVIVRCLTNPSA
jgi:hypothetical protein